MFRTLHAKLSAFLLALLCLVGFVWLELTAFTTQNYIQEVNQKLNRRLAGDLARDLAGKKLLPANFATNGKVQSQVGSEISRQMVLNPDIEIYVLDTAGKIISYSSAPGAVQEKSVALAPVERFLEGAVPFPILGDDPRQPGRMKTFSAARIGAPGEFAGYLYIILGGESYDSVAGVVGRSYIMRWSMFVAAGSLLMVFLAGLVFFRMLTTRLHALTRYVETFQAAGFEQSAEVQASAPRLAEPPRDEIDRLGLAYVEMSRCLSRQIQERQMAEQHRRELVSNVSHDLRTPLAALRGYLETLAMKREQFTAAETEQYLGIALKHSKRLENLVSELFELSKLDSPEAAPQREPFSLPELLQDVVQQYELPARQKGVALEADLDGGAIPFVTADIGLIQRAVENPLQNAIRHTPEGGTVKVKVERQSGDVLVTVADTGPGIAEEDIEHVFERSYRGARHRPEPGDGAGLGLAISKRIMELHGGRIWVESEPGQGATFMLSWPIEGEGVKKK